MPYPTIYKRHTYGDLIEALRALPDNTEVYGLTMTVVSYRGYYDRPCIEPGREDETYRALDLATFYEKQIGTEMTGWKGGDYEVSPDRLVHLAPEGSTGPGVIGLRKNPYNDLYGPVLLAEDYHF